MVRSWGRKYSSLLSEQYQKATDDMQGQELYNNSNLVLKPGDIFEMKDDFPKQINLFVPMQLMDFIIP